jgi:membrane protease YdiL (CAAX protease family)
MRVQPLKNSSQIAPKDRPGPGTSSIGYTLRTILMGKDGIRAGWSALLFVCIYLLLSMIETAGLAFFVKTEPASPLRPGPTLLQESCDLLVVGLATYVMARIENRKLFSYGFTGAYKAVRFTGGVICGLVALSALIGILWKSSLLVFDGRSLIGSAAWKYGIAWGAVYLVVGLFEESLLRGYLQYTLERGIGFWWAAVTLSLAFAIWHVSNGGESPLGLLVVGLGGLVFCLSLWYTKSLWWAVGFHAGWDWGQSYLYGTPNSGLVGEGQLLRSHPSGSPLWSGGTTGPEGSLVILPLLVAMVAGIWIWWGWKRKRQVKADCMLYAGKGASD